MSSIKIERALKVFTGHQGQFTIRKILEQIPGSFFEKLSGKEIGELMNVIHKNYHSAKNQGFSEAIGE